MTPRSPEREHEEMTYSPRTLRAIGWLTIVSALVGTALALVIIAWPHQVATSRWSFPFDASAYTAFQVSFFVHDVTLVPGLVAVASLAWAASSRAARIGLVLTVAAMVAGAAIELAAVGATHASTTSSAAALLGTAYGLMTLGFGVGFILAGLAFLRTPLVPGAVARWTYLLIGLWTLFPMLPSLFLPLVWGRITIGTWFFLFAGVGVVLLRAARSGTSTTAHTEIAPVDPVRTP